MEYTHKKFRTISLPYDFGMIARSNTRSFFSVAALIYAISVFSDSSECVLLLSSFWRTINGLIR